MPPAFLARERGRTCEQPADRVCPHRALQGSPRARIGRRAKKRPSGIDLRRGLCLPGSSAASRPASRMHSFESTRGARTRSRPICRAIRERRCTRSVFNSAESNRECESHARRARRSSNTRPCSRCEGANQRWPCADRVKSGSSGSERYRRFRVPRSCP